MQLPPIIVHSRNIANVKLAIEEHLGISCIKTCTFEERDFAYIFFNKVEETDSMKSFLTQLENTFSIEHNNITYVIESMYIDI